MSMWRILVLFVSSLTLCACENTDTRSDINTEINAENKSAAVTTVAVTGDSGNYTFTVTIESPDTGCEQYADWWEVVTNDGTLVYRRILSHSHVDEQPFTRSGGPVNVTADQDIIVRAHMNNAGYGEQVFKGNIDRGLAIDTLDSLFASELEMAEPLANSCAF